MWNSILWKLKKITWGPLTLMLAIAAAVVLVTHEEPRPSVILLLGPPGSGKSTIAKQIHGIRQLPHVSTGDILRMHRRDQTPLGKEAQRYMDNGLLVPDSLVVDMLNERLDKEDCQGGFVLDGFPRTLSQAKSLKELVGKREILAVSIQIPDDVCIDRILGRRENRDDDRLDVLEQRLALFHSQVGPLETYYERRGILRKIDGDASPWDVFAQIRPHIQ